MVRLIRRYKPYNNDLHFLTLPFPETFPNDLIMTRSSCRLAEWNDTAAMAELAAKAFDQNDLCGRYMHPERHKFPEDFVTFWRRDIRNHFFEPNVYYVVSTVDEPENRSSKVVGAAKWKRQGRNAPESTQSWATGSSSQS